MIYNIEVGLKDSQPDPRGTGIANSIVDLGIQSGGIAVSVNDCYWLEGTLTSEELVRIASELLVDPITQFYSFSTLQTTDTPDMHNVIVTYNPGVADPVEETLLQAISGMGITTVSAAKTAQHYVIKGLLCQEKLDIITSRLLVNPIIQRVVKELPKVFPQNPRYQFQLKLVDILSADEENLLQIGRDYTLNKDEILAIRSHFVSLGRNPTDAEMETLGQTWSEHCVHKTFKAHFEFEGQEIGNLLKNTIMQATKELSPDWCLSVFRDNAGVIAFDQNWAVCFKVETHNHPSAIEPYGGAATGVGGVVRDVMGTGMGAKPIANTDVFCFGPPDYDFERLPPGVLHPRRIFKGVRAGVADYGNRLGIPTLNGAILFDERYTTNPLIFCGTIGLMPRDMSQMGQQSPGDKVVLVGGRTGRDGIHGVTFASEQLTRDSTDLSFTSVQIGNAIMEKKVLDGQLKARDKKLYSRITDCGGGGLSSAVGEMAQETGVKIYLDKVPLKYAGLSYSEIWISESQERMLLAVPPANVDELICTFAEEGAEATVIGEFTDDRKLTLCYNENVVCDLDMQFLHGGIPQMNLVASWQKAIHPEPQITPLNDYNEMLLQILSAWNVCSKEWVIRQYDHEVQGSSVLKPLVGAQEDGPGDAAIIRPLADSACGLIISNGINTRYGDIDPYWMAASAIDEALRQIIAVGGSLEKVALLDNFCWGSVKESQSLGALILATQACHDLSLAYKAPFISGKDSLNNEYEHNGKRISIPHTLLISAISVMPEATKAISMDFKEAGNLIYVLGNTFAELGGSEYYAQLGYIGNRSPIVNAESSHKLMCDLSKATAQGLVCACHDLSDGGLAVALSEMAFAGGLGAKVTLRTLPLGEDIQQDDILLFSESNSRFLVEVDPRKLEEFENVLYDNAFAVIGEVTATDMLEIEGLQGNLVVSIPIQKLKESWQKPLRW
ncbi:MAG: phosphoribosylformylglycinamidine synthase subunit PurL [Dehalococcoidia bacterium]|nr:phosphoribosylformylglycinamidine synthase subunit PurL [Dehalococcoidia bacterium]